MGIAKWNGVLLTWCCFYSLESLLQFQVSNKMTVAFNFQGLTGNPGVQGPEGRFGPFGYKRGKKAFIINFLVLFKFGII